jgi:ribonuclease BN (tRNA processing enzyme)
VDEVRIDSIRLNHPQGGLGFRLKEGSFTMVFLTDNELGLAKGNRMPEFVQFAEGCDLLVHDAQYLPEEFPARRGWGHSSYEEVVAMAHQAGVRHLILTHHDPGRTDVEIQDIVARAREMAQAMGGPQFIDAAREGTCYRLAK